MSTLLIVFTILFIISSVALVLIILVQRPQGGGLAGAFGGAGGGGTDTAFGGRTGDVLTVATVGAFVVYLLLGVGLNIVDNVDMNGEAVDAAQTAENEAAVEAKDSSTAEVPGTVNGIQNPDAATKPVKVKPAAVVPATVVPQPVVPEDSVSPAADDASNAGG
jgi:preprotein translocase subunit SecG